MTFKEKLEKNGLEAGDNETIIVKESFEIPEFTEAESVASEGTPAEIYPILRAMTADKVTRNSTYYPKTELIGSESNGTGLNSWISPYPVPVILHHQDSPGFGGEVSDPLGRIIAVRFDESGNYLALVPEITDSTAIPKILDRRYHTLSIGVSANEVVCSICDQKIKSQGWCDHEKGETYQVKQADGTYQEQLCYYIIEGIKAREISFVNVPSDDQAQVVNTDIGKKGLKIWASSPGTISALTEMTTGNKINVSEFLEGYKVTESFKPGKKEKTMNEAQNTELLLDSVPNIIKAIDAIQAQESPDEKTITQVKEAVDKAGLSSDHSARVVLSETEGIAVIPNSLKSLFTEDFGDSQKEYTIPEILPLYETALTSQAEKAKTLEEQISTLTTESEDLKGKIKEWEEKAEAVLITQVDELKEQLLESQNKAHLRLAKSVALEMLKNKSAVAKGKTHQELTEHLLTRSEDSLIDTYNDLIAAYSESPASTEIEKVANPAAQDREEKESVSAKVAGLARIQEIYKHNKERMESDKESPTGESPIVKEDEIENLKMYFLGDGTVQVETDL